MKSLEASLIDRELEERKADYGTSEAMAIAAARQVLPTISMVVVVDSNAAMTGNISVPCVM
jgi:hypothetical protein